MAALVTAGAGVPVCKHGARGASSQCGTADVFEALGVAIELTPDGVRRCVEEAGIGFCFAPSFHPAFRFAAPARREIGIPTVFNLLGPMANPGRVRRQVIGVADPRFAERMLASLRAHGSTDSWVVHGGGLDELTTTGPSTVLALHHDDGAETFTVDPVELGLAPATHEQLVGGDPAHNAEVVRRVLGAERGAHRDIVVLNAAAALVVAGVGRRPPRGPGDGRAVDRQRQGGGGAGGDGPGVPGRRRHRRDRSSASRHRRPTSGPGFDTLGMALSLWAEIGVVDGPVPARARVVDERHPADVAFRRGDGEGELWVRSSIPVGRGLGFSGAMRVGGLVAAAAQRVPDPDDIDAARPAVLELAVELEGHADNVAASLYGGVVATAAGRVVPVPRCARPRDRGVDPGPRHVDAQVARRARRQRVVRRRRVQRRSHGAARRRARGRRRRGARRGHGGPAAPGRRGSPPSRRRTSPSPTGWPPARGAAGCRAAGRPSP